MKHRSSHRLMKISTALLCLTILLLPFSAPPLFAEDAKQSVEPTLSFSTGIASNHHPQISAQVVPTQPNRSINIYIFLPVITMLPVQTQADNRNAAQSPTTAATSTHPKAPNSLNIYIFLPAIAR